MFTNTEKEPLSSSVAIATPAWALRYYKAMGGVVISGVCSETAVCLWPTVEGTVFNKKHQQTQTCQVKKYNHNGYYYSCTEYRYQFLEQSHQVVLWEKTSCVETLDIQDELLLALTHALTEEEGIAGFLWHHESTWVCPEHDMILCCLWEMTADSTFCITSLHQWCRCDWQETKSLTGEHTRCCFAHLCIANLVLFCTRRAVQALVFILGVLLIGSSDRLKSIFLKIFCQNELAP